MRVSGRQGQLLRAAAELMGETLTGFVLERGDSSAPRPCSSGCSASS